MIPLNPAHQIETPGDLQRLMGLSYCPSDQQFAAISAPLQPVLVMAGAGSGKTDVMAARVVYLVATGKVRPENILGLTFTRKAASELRGRIMSALGQAGLAPRSELSGGSVEDDETLEPTVVTYNAYAGTLLTDHGLRIGHEPDTRVIADASRYQLAARVVSRYDGVVTSLSDDPKTVINNLLTLDAQLSEHLVTPERLRTFDNDHLDRLLPFAEVRGYVVPVRDAASAARRRLELVGLVERYRSYKAALGVMEFSDQVQATATLVAEHPAVIAAERERFRVVLLDEYQDTSVAQAALLQALFGRGHPVTAVGDPNQAIYGWRGASVSNILTFPEQFPADDADPDGALPAPILPLTVNRRSHRRILEVAGLVAEPLYRDFPQIQPLEAPQDAPLGEVVVDVAATLDEELNALPSATREASTKTRDGLWSQVAVLVRDNKTAAAVYTKLSDDSIPVEIVGLKGLAEVPEVAEIIATLRILHDITDNAAMLTLLSGARWSIGPRDLALLGRRAAEIARSATQGSGSESVEDDVFAELDRAAAGVDPADLACLSDAITSPFDSDSGDPGYSALALARVRLLAEELRLLRRSASEPLLDVVRRIVDISGADVELAASLSPSAPMRRDNIDLFVKAVAEFQAVDGDVSLGALLAWLNAEDDYGQGLDVATPSEANSVKLLTVHRSKGLEWDAVLLVGWSKGALPHANRRPTWLTTPELPYPLRGDARDLPLWPGLTRTGFKEFDEARHLAHDHDERRLAYVALTRARQWLRISAHAWGESSRKRPSGPSPYLTSIREYLADEGCPIRGWCETPERGAQHPLRGQDSSLPWPTSHQTGEVLRRREALGWWQENRDHLADLEAGCDIVAAAQIASWDAQIAHLTTESAAERQREIVVRPPANLSVTGLAALQRDPAEFARHLIRPMPQAPVAGARLGTAFHGFVEQHYLAQEDQSLWDEGALFPLTGLLEPDEVPDLLEPEVRDFAELDELQAAFLASPLAELKPVAVEPAFSVVIAGRVIRGRIDAVFKEPDGGVLIVDWKTNRRQDADPLQLAVYRVAWAELTGLDLTQVRAGFHYVRTGTTQIVDDLPDRAGLEAILTPAQ